MQDFLQRFIAQAVAEFFVFLLRYSPITISRFNFHYNFEFAKYGLVPGIGLEISSKDENIFASAEYNLITSLKVDASLPIEYELNRLRQEQVDALIRRAMRFRPGSAAYNNPQGVSNEEKARYQQRAVMHLANIEAMSEEDQAIFRNIAESISEDPALLERHMAHEVSRERALIRHVLEQEDLEVADFERRISLRDPTRRERRIELHIQLMNRRELELARIQEQIVNEVERGIRDRSGITARDVIREQREARETRERSDILYVQTVGINPLDPVLARRIGGAPNVERSSSSQQNSVQSDSQVTAQPPISETAAVASSSRTPAQSAISQNSAVASSSRVSYGTQAVSNQPDESQVALNDMRREGHAQAVERRLREQQKKNDNSGITRNVSVTLPACTERQMNVRAYLLENAFHTCDIKTFHIVEQNMFDPICIKAKIIDRCEELKNVKEKLLENETIMEKQIFENLSLLQIHFGPVEDLSFDWMESAAENMVTTHKQKINYGKQIKDLEKIIKWNENLINTLTLYT
uniref:Uncharacterized protein n=1 Tax=Cyanoptyche gloeocystis TaxID=77922 RepID=A0A3G1IW55_9EUKA|nr:hypothetical protein [Cyanoptyche gloeocystis]